MRRNIDTRKEALIEGLVSARQSDLAAARKVPAEQLDQVFLGTWSIKDLLAHLIGWDFTNIQAIQEILAGQPPEFFQYYDKDWQSYNARLVATYRKEPFEALLAEVESSHRQLISYLRSLSPAEVVNGKGRSPRGRTITIRNLLLSEAGDEQAHARQVQSFLSQLSLDQAMQFIPPM